MKKYEVLAKARTDIREHLVTLHMLTVELGLKRVLELGVGPGQSTVALLEAAKEIGGRVWSIDNGPCLRVRKMIEDYGLTPYWTFIMAEDLNVDWKEPVDHLFIDTCHLYPHVIAELRKFEPFVVDGGIITMHDTDGGDFWPGVPKAINEYMRGRKDLRFYNYRNCGGLGVIFKGRKRK